MLNGMLVQSGWGCNMFKWFKDLFTVKELQPKGSQYYYIASVRGAEFARATTKEQAEAEIRDLFESIDSSRKGGKGFGTHQNTSKNVRWKGFRSQCKVSRVCGYCGLNGNQCEKC